MNELIAIYHAVPGELLVLFGVFIGASGRALKAERTDIASGLVAVVVNMSLAYSVMWVIDAKGYATMKAIWFLSIVVAFLCSYLLGGLETAGQQFQEKPIPTLISWFVDFCEQVYSRWKTIKQDQK